MVKRVLSAAMMSALLAGCASAGPDYVAPITQPTALASANDEVFSRDTPVAAWWSQFDDPVLARLVDDALSDNRDLRVALSRVQQARAVFVESRFDQAPHFTADGSYIRAHEQTDASNGQRELYETAQLGFDAHWELDLFGRQRRAAEAARADLQAEQAGLVDAQVTVAAEVASNYFQLRGVQKQLDISRTTLDNLRDTQQLTEARWKLGAGSELDVQSSQARLKAIEADIPLLEVAETQYRHRLAVLTGNPPDALDAVLVPRATPAYAKSLALGDTAALLRQRPDVREAERRLASATARVGVATADLFPKISLTGFVGFLTGDPAALTGSNAKAWSVAPSISWAALDFGSVRARLRASKAEADGALAQYEQSVLLALEDTENALTSYSRQQSRLAIVTEQALAARRAESLAQIAYREGAGDFLTLLDAQRTRLSADDALAQTEAAVNVGVVQVYKALGGWREPGQDAAVAVR